CLTFARRLFVQSLGAEPHKSTKALPIISTIVRRSASHAVLDALRPILDVLARARASQRQRLNP
ncbi:hypothetical protein CVE35_17650, partial [Pseudomonas syringae pv. actinidiae]|nr:hypothetical protein [Pseudomonas syringae pv. actinidiae]NAT53490.1 hypothetical protein [Pseudomonas syringae pv. actinidiae]